ncbi:MAG TPA: LptF/LptG family permease [Bacteroidales bacterium]|nr:LptF/LptG family permease [Bacteroidales bacterium]
MKKLYKLTLSSFLGPFVLTFFIVVFVLLMQFLWKYIDDLVGKGLQVSVISELLLYTSASLVPMALPLAVLLASLMAFGNLGENNELLALKSAGISLRRIMNPLIVLIMVITVGAFLFNNYVLPYTNLRFRSLLYDIQRQNPELQIKTGIFDNTLEGYSIRIGEKDPHTSLLRNIMIYDHTDHVGNIIVTIADSGYMRMTEDKRYLLLILYNGETYTEMQKQRRRVRDKSYPSRRDKFEKQEMIIELVDFGLKRTDENLFKSSYQMMNLKQLAFVEDSLKDDVQISHRSLQRTLRKSSYYKNKSYLKRTNLIPPSRKINAVPDSLNADTTINSEEQGRIINLDLDSIYSHLNDNEKDRILSQSINYARSTMNFINNNYVNTDNKVRRLRKYEIETQRKFTLSLACLIFFFIGAPLGAIIRKGGLGMPVVVSVAFFLLYYIISLTGEKFVRESVISPFSGMWISTFILIPLGAFLTYKASTDSVIMNVDTYLNFFKRLFKKRKS